MLDPISLVGRLVDDEFVRKFLRTFSEELSYDGSDPPLPERRNFVGVDSEIELLADETDRIRSVFLYLNGYQGHRENTRALSPQDSTRV